MNETSSTYRSPWLVKFTDGTPPEELDDGLHWFPVGPTGDGRVMWRRPEMALNPLRLSSYVFRYVLDTLDSDEQVELLLSDDGATFKGDDHLRRLAWDFASENRSMEDVVKMLKRLCRVDQRHHAFAHLMLDLAHDLRLPLE